MLTCRQCQETKEKHAFGIRPRSTTICKACKDQNAKAYQNRWRENNAAHVKRRSKKHHLKKYGLSIDIYEALNQRQQGKCLICLQPEPNGQDLCVDHDHQTGKVRGLICHRCNAGLGYFRDNPHLMIKAAFYVNGENTALGLYDSPEPSTDALRQTFESLIS